MQINVKITVCALKTFDKKQKAKLVSDVNLLVALKVLALRIMSKVKNPNKHDQTLDGAHK